MTPYIRHLIAPSTLLEAAALTLFIIMIAVYAGIGDAP